MTLRAKCDCGSKVGKGRKGQICLVCYRKKIKRKCQSCGVEFVPKWKNRFCSYACSVVAVRAAKQPQERPCTNCGIVFAKFRASTRRFKNSFCSRECQYAFNRGNRHACYRGNRRQDRGANWKERSHAARERDGNLCVCCNEPDGKRISVDHIVPYRLAVQWSPDPNNLINLACLCRQNRHRIAIIAWRCGRIQDGNG